MPNAFDTSSKIYDVDMGVLEQEGSTATDTTSDNYLEATLQTLSAHSVRLSEVASKLKEANAKFVDLGVGKKEELKILQAEEKENGYLVPNSRDYTLPASRRRENRKLRSTKSRSHFQDVVDTERQVLGPIRDTNTRITKVKDADNALKPKRGSEEWRRKVNYGNRDYTIRNQINGIETMTALISDALEKVFTHIKKCKGLYNLGNRYLGREEIMEDDEFTRFMEADEEIESGTAACEEAEEMLDLLDGWFNSLEGEQD